MIEFYTEKVSIIVATYRREVTLRKSLLSIVHQTHRNIEIIVVDDNASTEWNGKVRKIIEEMRLITDICIEHLINYENLGSAKSRNKGIELATGRFVSFLDDDDEYLNRKVEIQLQRMLLDSSDYSLTGIELYDESNKLIERRTRNILRGMNSFELLKYHLMHHLTGTDTLMFKKEYLIRIGMFAPIDIGDEFYLICRAIQGNGRVSFIEEHLVRALVHTQSEGLSSGDGKIEGENKLFAFKQKYFDQLSESEVSYIIMRHYAVLGFTELRRRNYFKTLIYSFKAFFSNPSSFIDLIKNRKR